MAEFNYKILNQISACGELVLKWNTVVGLSKIGLICGVTESISHECELVSEEKTINRPPSFNVQLMQIFKRQNLTAKVVRI